MPNIRPPPIFLLFSYWPKLLGLYTKYTFLVSLLLICKSDRFSQKRVGRIRMLDFVEMDAVRTILLERRQVELWTIKRAVQYRLLQLHVDWNINLILLNCRLFWNLFWWFVNSTRDHQSARVFLYIIPGLVVRNFLVPWKSNSFQMFRIQSNFQYNKSGRETQR